MESNWLIHITVLISLTVSIIWFYHFFASILSWIESITHRNNHEAYYYYCLAESLLYEDDDDPDGDDGEPLPKPIPLKAVNNGKT